MSKKKFKQTYQQISKVAKVSTGTFGFKGINWEQVKVNNYHPPMSEE